MALDKLIKIDGGGISTTSDYRVGVITATKFVGPIEGSITATDATFSGNVSIAGTLTYEDVTNIDSVGIITAQSDIHVGGGVSAVGVVTAAAVDVDDFLDVGSNIKLGNAGVITATSFVGSGAALTGIDATAIKDSGGNVKIQAQASGAIHSGVSTFQDIDVDGHTNLDNVSIAGVTTFSGGLTATGIDLNGDIDVDGHTNLDNVNIAGVTTSSHLTINGDLTINDNYPSIYLNDTDSDSDFMLQNQNGVFTVYDATNNADRFEILSNGTVRSPHYTLQSQSPSITFNDTNHDSDFMIQNANGLLKIYDNTNGADRFGVNSSGSVYVYGNELYIGDSIIHNGDANTKIRFPSNDTISFETGGSERVRITSAGRIGIDRPSPTQKLQVGGDSGDACLSLMRTNAASNGNAWGHVFFENSSDATLASISARRESAADDAYLAFSTQSSGNAIAEKLRINSDGDVLISHTTTPSADIKLLVGGNAGVTDGKYFSFRASYGNTSEPAAHAIKFDSAIGSSGGLHYYGYGGMHFDLGGQPRIQFTQTGNILTSGNTQLIGSNTSDGSDNKAIMMNGGGAVSDSRGGYVLVHGNEHSSFPGVTRLHAGNVGTAYIAFNTAGSERLRITSTGKVLIGHDTPTEIGVGAGYQMPLQVIGTSYDTSGMVLARYANDGNGPTLAFVKSRNATKGAQTIVQANDNLGMIRFLGSDGTDTQNAAARIRAFCDGTPASNKIPGRITFETTDTLTYARERMRIDSSGRVVIGGPGSNAGGSNTYIGGGALAVLGTPYTPNTYACFAMGRVGANVTANTTITNIRLNGGTLGTGRGAEINAAADANWSDGSSHPTRLTFHTVASSSTGSTERLRISSTGKVGINIAGSDNTSPVRNLDIADSSGAILRLISTDDSLGANERLGEIEFYTDDDDGGHIGAFVKAIADPSDSFGRRTALTFGTQSTEAGNAVERVRINAQGNVLIGTTSYSYAKPLVVQGSSGSMISLFNGGTTTYAANTNTSIEFRLNTGSTGNTNGSCEIRAFKDNGTNGDNARSLSFYTGSNGGSPVERLRIQSSGHVVPGANNSYDLGSTSLGWRNVYMNDLNLSNMKGDKNDVDGTQGSWTIQEGKDDLYIINRLNGKKFKIKMEEIS